MQRLPRLAEKENYLAFAGGAVMMLLVAGNNLLDLSFEGTPPWAMVLCVGFFAAWFGVVIWFASFGIVALQDVEIDRDEIRVCLGPVVLRRIPLSEVKTVGVSSAMQNKNRDFNGRRTEMFLVLSGCTADELNEKGRRLLNSSRTVKLSQDMSVTLKGPYAAAQAYLLHHMLGSLLWVHHTPEMEAALRNRLNTTLFLIPERQDAL